MRGTLARRLRSQAATMTPTLARFVLREASPDRNLYRRLKKLHRRHARRWPR